MLSLYKRFDFHVSPQDAFWITQIIRLHTNQIWTNSDLYFSIQNFTQILEIQKFKAELFSLVFSGLWTQPGYNIYMCILSILHGTVVILDWGWLLLLVITDWYVFKCSSTQIHTNAIDDSGGSRTLVINKTVYFKAMQQFSWAAEALRKTEAFIWEHVKAWGNKRK